MESLKINKKRTFRVRINRTDTRKGEPYLSLVALTDRYIELEFQSDANIQPELKPLMEREN